jgi:ornithine cyclodeaminase/alanine dehydrogenase-like protein (mu-crystallin family)
MHPTENDIRQLHPARVIAALEAAFRDRFDSITLPPRTYVETTPGFFLIMACYDRNHSALGMKFVAVHKAPRNADERIQATYILFDPATAIPRLIIPANYLTDLRTAATSALATKFLANEDARVLGIFGTGRQARAHLKVMPCVRNFKRVLICGTDLNRARAFAQAEASSTDLPIEPVDAETCVSESDVICACTNTATPLFDGNRLRPGTHLNLVGAFQPHTREVDSLTIASARIVVDTYDGALAEAGDLLIPLSEGAISRPHILADLHQLVAGQQGIRQNRNSITIFKSVGCALEDLVTAELLL